MKKILIGLLLLIMITAGLAPFITGLLAEKYVRQAVSNFNEMYSETGLSYNIEIKEYNRGFFSSNIDWIIHTGELETFYGVADILLHEEASHGFGTVTSITTLDQNPWFTTFVQEQLEGVNPLNITTRYNVFGISTSTVRLDAFSMSIDEENLVVKPGIMTVSIDKDLKNFTTDFNLEGLNIGETVDINMLMAHADLKMYSTYIWEGVLDYTLGSIIIKDLQNGQQPVELNNLKIGYQLDHDQQRNTLSCQVNYSADKIAADGKELVNNPSLALILKGLDSGAFEEFMKIYMETITDAIETGLLDPANQEAAQAELEQQFLGLGMKLAGTAEKFLREGLEITIDKINAELPEGDLNGKLSIRLNQDMTIAQLVPVAAHPDLIFDYFSVSTDLRLPTALVGDTTMLTNPLLPDMQTGIFTINGDYLVHQAKGQDGKLVLNGKELSLQSLFQ